MAKKVRKKLDEDEKYHKFQFPEFDVRGFILHELEQSYATLYALGFAVLFALAAWRITLVGLSNSLGVLPFSLACIGVGIAGDVVMLLVVRKFRHPSSLEYRRGDWASLASVYLFLFLGIWALLLNW
jgi:hypothetical protein